MSTIRIMGEYLHVEPYKDLIMILKVVPTDILVKIYPTLQEVNYDREGSKGTVCEVSKGLLWIVAQCTTILFKIGYRFLK